MSDAPSTLRVPLPRERGRSDWRHAPPLSRRRRGRGTAKRWRGRLALAAALLATPAFAHEGHHEQMALPEAVQHLVSQPDHQMMFAALVVLVAVGGWAWRRSAK